MQPPLSRPQRGEPGAPRVPERPPSPCLGSALRGALRAGGGSGRQRRFRVPRPRRGTGNFSLCCLLIWSALVRAQGTAVLVPAEVSWVTLAPDPRADGDRQLPGAQPQPGRQDALCAPRGAPRRRPAPGEEQVLRLPLGGDVAPASRLRVGDTSCLPRAWCPESGHPS